MVTAEERFLLFIINRDYLLSLLVLVLTYPLLLFILV